MHVLGTSPKKVAIVGCGPSMQDFVNIQASHRPVGFCVDEVWTINGAGKALKSDLTFVMDDAHLMRASGSDLYDTLPAGVVTSAPRREGDHAYPLAEVLSIPGARDYLNHSAVYALAYAIAIGVEEICIFGCDYISEANAYKSGGNTWPFRYMACMAFWCGIAAARGIHVTPTPTSPLLDADGHSTKKFYGYLVPPVVKCEGE